MALSESLSKVDFRTNICPVGIFYYCLNDEDKKAFDKALSHKIPVNTMLLALQNEGHTISWGALDKHFKKLCRCAK